MTDQAERARSAAGAGAPSGHSGSSATGPGQNARGAAEPDRSQQRGGGPGTLADERPLPEVRRRLRGLRRAYAPHDHRPLGGYVATLAAYAGVVGGLAAAVRTTGARVPERPAAADVLLVGVATHKLSRLLAKDSVTSPLRAPFTRYREPSGESEVNEDVRAEEGSPSHAIGELLSCPFCLAMWVATGFTGGLVLAPRLTRLVATGFTAVAISDFLQLVYAAAKKSAG